MPDATTTASSLLKPGGKSSHFSSYEADCPGSTSRAEQRSWKLLPGENRAFLSDLFQREKLIVWRPWKFFDYLMLPEEGGL